VQIAGLDSGATSFSDTALVPGSLYYYRVQAASPAGDSVPATAIAATLTNLQAWRQKYFATTESAGGAADSFDYDADGLPNLVEYALGTDPTIPDAVPPTASIDTVGADTFLTLSVPRAGIPSDVTCLVEVADRPGGWSDNVTILENSPAFLKARDNVPIGSANARFIRLRVTAP
jgi:hypothetical protein